MILLGARRTTTLITLVLLGVVRGFAPSASRSFGTVTRIPAPLMCICVDCVHVTNCAAYHFVETKHEQPHMNENPTFEPVNGSPTIHVNVRTIRTKEDRDAEAERMWREYKAEEAAATATESNELHGQTVYDLSPVTTTEYDVVACESFVEDKGAWVRNMPEEIRLANPDFVPT